MKRHSSSMLSYLSLVVFIALSILCVFVDAQVLFSKDFGDGSLAGWTGNGQIVTDGYEGL
jgi:hypothetical protein